MNIDKLKEWVDFAQSFGEGDSWDQLFEGQGESAVKKTPAKAANAVNAVKPAKPAKVEYPLADIYQSASEITVVAELPGVRKEDLTLAVSCDVLHLSCNARPPVYAGSPVQSERYAGVFDRQIRLPAAVEGSAVSASLADGLLTVRFRTTANLGEPITLD